MTIGATAPSLKANSSPWTSEDEERRQRIYDSLVAPDDPAAALATATRPLDGRPARPRGGAGDPGQSRRARVSRPACSRTSASASALNPPISRRRFKLVQSFHPAGVGASGIAESLLLQLEHKARRTPSNTGSCGIISRPSPASASRRSPEALGTSANASQRRRSASAASRPIPAASLIPTENPHILPDVVIERDDDGQWQSPPDQRTSAEPAHQ